MHPYFNGLIRRLGLQQIKLASMRKAISTLKTQTKAIMVAEYIYCYGNNYAGVNVSNLDVFLYSLQKYSQDSDIVLLVDKSEMQYVDKLSALFPVHAVLLQPVNEAAMEQCLTRG